ncbi:insulinase family protein [bacterium]|nr:insulinase family protein [bacterium]
MQYTKKDLGSYNLHFIKTDNYKTITVKIYFRERINKDTITKRNFLNSMLFLSCKDYPTKREMTLKSQELYAATVTYNSRRLGNYLDSIYTLKVLNDTYTEEDNFKNSLSFFSSILLNPNIENKAFKENDFNVIHSRMKSNLEGLEDDKASYATVRLLDEIDKDSSVSIRTIGYLEDLENITKENLYDYYLYMINHDLIDIFVLGDIDVDEVSKMIQDEFKIETFKRKNDDLHLNVCERNKPKYIEEAVDAKQSQLALALSLKDLTPYERNYPLTLYNIILGGGDNSFLFQEVREKASLAYYIGSTPNKCDDLILIRSGVTPTMENKAIALIKKQIKRLKSADFTNDDVKKAKEYFTTALDDMLESPLEIIDCYYMMEILGVDDFKTKREKMLMVTKEEIVEVAKKVSIHTIFCLKGVNNE